jgi:hypothetical protein
MPTKKTQPKSFWSSVSGILTGIAAIVTALTGLYVAVNKDSQARPTVTSGPAPSVEREADRKSSDVRGSRDHTTWPSIVDDTFTDIVTKWHAGSFRDDNSVLDLRILDGKFRWDFENFKPFERYEEAPYSPVVDFYLAVDARLLKSAAHGPVISLLFGRSLNRDYAFRLSKKGDRTFFGLGRFDGAQHELLIDWTPASFAMEQVNRLAVLVDNQNIKLFLNSVNVGGYRDPNFMGGKTGLAVSAYSAGSMVAEFDNFELRRKPE